jgi:steroid delta-isomerase-like uncharacterized protein
MPRRIVPIVPIVAVLLAALAAGSLDSPGPVGLSAAQEASPAATPTSCPATTQEEKKGLVRRFYEEAWGRGDLAVLDAVLADEYVLRISRLARATRPAADPTTRGRAAMGETITRFRTDFPDLRVTVEALVAEEDTVAVRMTWTGTQADDLEPWGAPDTGRPMARVSASFVQVACGRIAGVWTLPDNLSMLRQLGVISDAELRTVDTPTVATPAP